MKHMPKILFFLLIVLLLCQVGTVFGQATDDTSSTGTDPLNALFTLESLLSLQGAAAASWLVPNVLGTLIGPRFDRFRLWAAFLIGMGLALLTAAIAKDTSGVKWILALFNGFLIFSSAVGINQGAGAATTKSRTREIPSDGGFIVNWL
ncbi:MAG: hypothetical protein ABI700_00800 [Chloroflexota bacterium]